MELSNKAISELIGLSKDLTAAREAFDNCFHPERRFNLGISFETFGTPEHKAMFKCMRESYFFMIGLSYDAILDLEALADIGAQYCEIKNGVVCSYPSFSFTGIDQKRDFEARREYYRELFPSDGFRREAVLFLLWKPLDAFLRVAAMVLKLGLKDEVTAAASVQKVKT